MFRGLLVGYRVDWYSRLDSTIFCRLRARIFVIPLILFVSEAPVGGLCGRCLLSQRTFLLLFMTLFLLERQLHLDFYFVSILIFTLEACARDNLVLGIELI